jgi:TPR repeat protein
MLVRGDGASKNPSKAAVWFLKAAKQENGFAQRQLAYLYYTGNGVPVDFARCEAWYRRSASAGRDPWAMNDLAWFLSTCPDEKFHNGREAVEIARTAVKVIEEASGEQRHEMIDTMAAALARCGQFTEALVWQKRCLSLLKEDKVLEEPDRKKLETEFNERLKLYTGKKAYSDKPAKPEKEGEPLPNDTVLEDAKQTAPNIQAPKQSKPAPRKESVT